MKIKRYKALIECYKDIIKKSSGGQIFFQQLLVDYDFAPNRDYEYRYMSISFSRDAQKDAVSTDTIDRFRIYYTTYTLTDKLYDALFGNALAITNNYKDIANKFSEIIGKKVIIAIRTGEVFLPIDGFDLKFISHSNKSIKLRLLLAEDAEFLKSEEAQTPALFNVQELHTFNCLAFNSIREGLSELGLTVKEANDEGDKISMQITNTNRLNLELRCVLNKYKDKILSEMFNGELKKFLDDSGLSLEYFWISNTVNNLPSKIKFEKNKLKGENNETK